MTNTDKRTPQDACLLCKIMLATKKNSHIFPKFWVKNMLITDDNKREGWQISTASKSIDKLGQKVQDSPKQDYMFCPKCEDNFSILERYVANNFYNSFRETTAAQDFTAKRNKDEELDYLTALKVHPVMFKLFIYSLIWRASVSTDSVFNNFKLPVEIEEPLRELLYTFVKATESATISHIQEHSLEFPHLPMNIITTKTASNATANFIQPLLDSDHSRVIVFANEFIVILYLDWNAPRQGGHAYNLADSPLTISILSLQEWNQLKQGLIQFFMKLISINNNLK